MFSNTLFYGLIFIQVLGALEAPWMLLKEHRCTVQFRFAYQNVRLVLMLPPMKWHSTANCCRTNFINFPAKLRGKTSIKPKTNRLNRHAAVSFASNCNVLDVNFAANQDTAKKEGRICSPSLHICRSFP